MTGLRRWRGAGTVALVCTVAGCGDFDVPTGVVDGEVRVVPLVESLEADSVGAVVEGVGFRVVERKGEDPPVPNALVAFFAPGEACGRPLRPSGYTDDDGVVTTDWELGTQTGECRLDGQAVSASGGVRGSGTARIEVLPGQGDVVTWMALGELLEGTGSLAVTGPGDVVLDRFTHEVPWRFRVVEGPLRTAGETLGSEGARTLIPTGGAGSAAVELVSAWGPFETLRAWVCTVGDTQVVRLYRPTSEGDPGPGC